MRVLVSGASNHSTDYGWVTRERALVIVLAFATVLAFYLCFEMLRPFLPALAWALALAIVARPLHQWLAARFANADVAAGLTVLLVGLIIVAPAILVVQQITQEAANGLQEAQASVEDGRWRELAENQPWLAPIMEWLEDNNVDLRREGPRVVQQLAAHLSTLVSGSALAIVQLMLTLFILYFFFRDHRAMLSRLRHLVPLAVHETDEVLQRVDDTVHATVYGTLLVALVQGLLGGLMFWWLGLPAPITWGLVMALLAVVPYLGAFVVWAPAALFLALEGHTGKALLLAGWGTIVVGLIDNLLYPLFVGKRLRLHTLLAFMAIVGGLAVFGASGLILGPVVLAITIALVDVWRRRTANGQAAEDGVDDPGPLVAAKDAAPAEAHSAT